MLVYLHIEILFICWGFFLVKILGKATFLQNSVYTLPKVQHFIIIFMYYFYLIFSPFSTGVWQASGCIRLWTGAQRLHTSLLRRYGRLLQVRLFQHACACMLYIYIYIKYYINIPVQILDVWVIYIVKNLTPMFVFSTDGPYWAGWEGILAFS